METKTKKRIRDFLKWVIGNTVWDYFRRGISVLGSLFATWKTYIRPSVSGWLAKMNISLWIAIGVMLIGFFVIIWAVLSFLFRLYKQMRQNHNDKVKLKCKIRKDGNEIYIDVKNNECFIDIIRILFRGEFIYQDEVIKDSLEWIEGSNKKGETNISRCKTKTLHFSTIQPVERTYTIHLLKRELTFPFQNDKTIALIIEGFTSAPVTRSTKRNINGMILILESISKGELNFEIGVEH